MTFTMQTLPVLLRFRNGVPGRFLVGWILILTLNLTHAQVLLSPTSYELAFDLDFKNELLRSSVRITLQNSSKAPLTNASFLLYRLLQLRSVKDAHGHDLPFTQTVTTFNDFGKFQVNQILVNLPKAIAPGGQTTLEFNYDGYLLGYAETGMRYIQDKIDPEFTILRQDSYCYPQPGETASLSANRSLSNWKFTWSAKITVLKDLVVANGGHLEATDVQGDSATFQFSSLKPSWRMDFAIAKYTRISSGSIHVYHLPGDAAGAERVAFAAGQAMELFTKWFGPLRDGTAGLTFIEIPDGWGSQADVTTVIQTAAAFRDPRQHRQVYHEISHLWNVPATDPPSPRIEEGLATFLEYLVAQQITADSDPIIDRRANQVVERLRSGLSDHPEWTNTPLADYGRANLTGLSYSVGALFFDLLYRLVGQETFNSVLRKYYSEFSANGGSIKDLSAIITSTSKRDVSSLIQDWLFTTAWSKRVLATTNILDLADYYRRSVPK